MDPEKLPPLYEQYLDDPEVGSEKPWENAGMTCQVDGYDEDYNGYEHYWHCEEPAAFRAMNHEPPEVMLACARHAEEFDHVTPIEERRQ